MRVAEFQAAQFPFRRELGNEWITFWVQVGGCGAWLDIIVGLIGRDHFAILWRERGRRINLHFRRCGLTFNGSAIRHRRAKLLAARRFCLKSGVAFGCFARIFVGFSGNAAFAVYYHATVWQFAIWSRKQRHRCRLQFGNSFQHTWCQLVGRCKRVTAIVVRNDREFFTARIELCDLILQRRQVRHAQFVAAISLQIFNAGGRRCGRFGRYEIDRIRIRRSQRQFGSGHRRHRHALKLQRLRLKSGIRRTRQRTSVWNLLRAGIVCGLLLWRSALQDGSSAAHRAASHKAHACGIAYTFLPRLAGRKVCKCLFLSGLRHFLQRTFAENGFSNACWQTARNAARSFSACCARYDARFGVTHQLTGGATDRSGTETGHDCRGCVL